ncbi:MAG: type III pantothenate kinase [Clostridia bacterium]|mgnify:CR=1 FL=1|nr:type III pantothenate kinase [Clostridia bacterium]
MVLAIDVGNTNIVIGVFDGDKLCFIARMASDQNRTSDETAVQLKAVLSIYDINISLIDGAIVSSVVPMITEPLSNAIKILIGKKPLVVGPGMKTGINISIDNPAQLGSDLLVDSVAASALYPKPLIVADMGTATTLTVVNDKNSIIGGAILPGVKTSLNALTSNTAQLQQISIEAPKKAIGSNTVDCMRSGTVLGNASMLDGMIDRFNEELGAECFVVSTGGLAEVISRHTKHKVIYNPNLLLEGLYILYKKNI